MSILVACPQDTRSRVAARVVATRSGMRCAHAPMENRAADAQRALQWGTGLPQAHQNRALLIPTGERGVGKSMDVNRMRRWLNLRADRVTRSRHFARRARHEITSCPPCAYFVC